MPQFCKELVNYTHMFKGTAFESSFFTFSAVFKCMAMLDEVSEESKRICLRQ
jgi:hypothetical protein